MTLRMDAVDMRPTFEWHSAGAVAAVAGADHNTILI